MSGWPGQIVEHPRSQGSVSLQGMREEFSYVSSHLLLICSINYCLSFYDSHNIKILFSNIIAPFYFELLFPDKARHIFISWSPETTVTR